MGKTRTICFLISMLVLCSSSLFAQKDVFARKMIIPVPAGQTEFGEMVAGVDLDGDGKPEIYAVNNDVNDTGAELVPHIYKYVQNGTSWDSVWSAALPIPLQNTWPALTYGDWDNDGKMEIIWGPVNNLDATTNPNPSRIVVFEAHPGVDLAMGVPDGAGGYKPNAQWTITSAASVNLRPFRWFLTDLKGDGKKELVFCDRAGTGNSYYKFGVVSVNTIPDNGDTTGVVWKLEFAGKDSSLAAGTLYDLAVIDSTIYLFHQATAGTVTIVQYANGAYRIAKRQANVVPGGSWKSACVVDLDNNGKKEIVIGSTGTGTPQVYLLQPDGDSLKSTMIATLPLGGASARIFGGTSGDFDNDGRLDFAFGSRDATPDAAVARLRYLGGDITNPANYATSIIDQGASGSNIGGRWDIFGAANLDSDPEAEVLYSQGYPLTGQPIIMLDRHSFNWIPIAEARKDTNGDFQPDLRGDTVTVIGVINSTNVQTTQFGYFMQDDSAGMEIFAPSLTGAPTVAPGYRVAVTGKIDYYRGTTEIVPLNLATDVVVLDTGRTLTKVPLTIAQFKANPEKYESRLISLQPVMPLFTSAQWPAATASANLNIWDGRDTLILRVDSDTEVDGSPFPTFPVRLSGVATQYTSAATVYNNGYQITPFFVSDFTPINTPPLNNIALVSPANGSSLYVADAGQVFDFTWHKAVDWNNDALLYQFKPAAFAGLVSNNSGADTVKTVTGAQLLTYLGANDSLAFRWTVQAKDPANPLVTSIDTFTVMLRKLTPAPGWSQDSSNVTVSLRSVSAVSPMVAWMCGQNGTILRTIDGGKTWTSVGGGPISTTSTLNNIYAVSDQIAYTTNSPDSANIYRTTDGGTTWERVFNDPVTATAFTDAIHMFDAQHGIALGDPAGGYWFIVETTDGGNTWQHLINEPTQNGTESGYTNCLAAVGTTHIWFGTNNSRIYRSTDGGATWSSSPTTNVSSFSVWFNDTQFGVAGFGSGKVETSSDGGATWTSVTVPGATGTVYGITGFGKDFWLTSGSTVFHSTDRGATWTAEATSPSGTFRHISFVKSGTYVTGWTQTTTGKIMAFSGTLTGVKEQTPVEIPTTFALEQNYPNPFNPTTTIRFALPTQAYVSVKIYDILGREVVTLFDQSRDAGVVQVVWNGTNNTGVQVASGMYVYRMEARPSNGSSPFVSVKKMMLLK